MGMVNHITIYYSDNKMSQLNFALENIIRIASDRPITWFITSIYKNDEYRKNILDQNDSFFIDQDYSSTLIGDTNKLQQIFEFKRIWKQVDDVTKAYIKKSMMVLVMISQKYILNL